MRAGRLDQLAKMAMPVNKVKINIKLLSLNDNRSISGPIGQTGPSGARGERGFPGERGVPGKQECDQSDSILNDKQNNRWISGAVGA